MTRPDSGYRTPTTAVWPLLLVVITAGGALLLSGTGPRRPDNFVDPTGPPDEPQGEGERPEDAVGTSPRGPDLPGPLEVPDLHKGRPDSRAVEVVLLALLFVGLAGLVTLFSKKGRAWLLPPPSRAPRTRWGGVEAVQGVMVAVAFMMFAGALAGRFFHGSTLGESAVGIATQLLLVAAILAITVPFARGDGDGRSWPFRRAALGALGLSLDDFRKNALRGLAGGAMALAIAVAASVLVGLLCEALGIKVPPHPMIERAGTTAGPLELAVIFFSAVVVAPFAEEVVFRGFIFPSVRDRWGLPAGILVSSLLFGLVHPGLPAVAATFVLGAVFCALYERSGTLVAPVTAHAFFNLTMLSLSLLQRFGV